jgi:hypothetical protein
MRVKRARFILLKPDVSTTAVGHQYRVLCKLKPEEEREAEAEFEALHFEGGAEGL